MVASMVRDSFVMDGDESKDELQFLCSATLTHRKPFLEREEEARTAPNRVLYYRKNADNDRLIEACTVKLRADPANLRALLIRASSQVKKGESINLGRQNPDSEQYTSPEGRDINVEARCFIPGEASLLPLRHQSCGPLATTGCFCFALQSCKGTVER
jgi:hypothetical protein